MTHVRKVTNSELTTFAWCRRNWWLSSVRGLRPIVDTSISRPEGLGTLVHRGLALWYQQGCPTGDTGLNGVLSEIEAAVAASISGCVDDTTSTKAAAHLDLATIMLSGYVGWIEQEGADSDLGDVVGTEVPIEADLDIGGGVTLLGKVDLVKTRSPDGGVVLVDHKTVQSLVDLARSVYLSPQFRTYALIMRLRGTPVVAVEANGLRKVKRSAAAKPPFYGRFSAAYNDDVLRSHYKQVTSRVVEMLHAEARFSEGEDHHKVVPPTPTRDCWWRCQFRDVCPSFDDGGDPESVLDLDFIKYNPLERYGQEQDDDI